ncbi:Hypothetical predicted protein, partial [Prunus dulcis]
ETLSEEFSSKPVELSMPSLKQVTVTSYTGTEDEVNFMKILSTQGVALEKIILVRGHVGAKSRVQMAKKKKEQNRSKASRILNTDEASNENLNDLPEELLLRILTFLPTLDSIQTSLICQQWRPIWSRVPSLNFPFELFPSYEPPLDTRQFFAEFIDRVLILRSNSPIHTFRLSFIYHDHYGSHVDSWVCSAITHLHARELHLDFFIHKDFHDEDTFNHRYDFPFSVLRNGFVEKLGLTGCDLTLPAKMSTTFLLDYVRALELQNCWGHHHLKIYSTRLKKQVLGYFYDSEIQETLVIDCPNLFSISFDCCAFDKFILNNASSLVEFHVDMVHLIYRSYRYWSKVVRLLLQAPNVKHLNVQNWWFKFLTSKEDSFPKSFMLHNLNLLELRTGFTQYDLVGMAALLKLCPNLETMILEYLFKKRAD